MGGLEGRGEAMGEEGRKGDGWEATVGKNGPQGLVYVPHVRKL